MEHPRQACSGQPKTPGSKKARYTINCLRPSNRSSRLTLPLGPSNSYFFSTAIHGIRRRSAASASRERVKAFSFTRSCCRAASHSCSDTIGGVFIATPLSGAPCLSLCLLPSVSSSSFSPFVGFLHFVFDCVSGGYVRIHTNCGFRAPVLVKLLATRVPASTSVRDFIAGLSQTLDLHGRTHSWAREKVGSS